MDLVVRRPYPSVDAWLREEAHLFTAERCWLVGVDAPPGTTAQVTIGLKGDDPMIAATVLVEGIAGDFNGTPLLAVRWLELDQASIETLQSLLRIDFHALPSASELPLPPLSSAPLGVAVPPSQEVVAIDADIASVRSEAPAPPAPAPRVEAPVASIFAEGADMLDRLRARPLAEADKRAILTRGRELRSGGPR